jgi:[ribosomal protein S5]-alanine N-acetyltransferase
MLATALPALRLRPWRPADREALLRHANDRAVWRNMADRFPHPYTEADADNWFVLANAPGASVHLALDLAGVAIGGAGVIAGEGVDFHTGEFGYWLGRAHWGHGYATAAGVALREHAFAQGRFKRLQARVYAWNPASMRVLEKAGFAREAMQRRSVFKDGQLIDSVLYAAVRED